MLQLLSSLYEEAVNDLISDRRSGDTHQQFKHAEAAAVARVLGSLYNLPAAIKAAADEIEQRKAVMEKMKAAGDQKMPGFINAQRAASEAGMPSYQQFLENQKAPKEGGK